MGARVASWLFHRGFSDLLRRNLRRSSTNNLSVPFSDPQHREEVTRINLAGVTFYFSGSTIATVNNFIIKKVVICRRRLCLFRLGFINKTILVEIAKKRHDARRCSTTISERSRFLDNQGVRKQGAYGKWANETILSSLLIKKGHPDFVRENMYNFLQ
jgi:hypothetical protein